MNEAKLSPALQSQPKKTCRRRVLIAVAILAILAAILLPVGLLVIQKDVVPNDTCQGATELSTDGTTVKGTFNGATLGEDELGFYCGHSGDNGPVIWFKFQGTDSLVSIDHEGYYFAVYYGECDGLYSVLDDAAYENMTSAGCLQGYDHPLYDYPLFYAQAQKVYYIQVSGASYHMVYGSQHEYNKFEISVSQSESVLAVNDKCETALEVPSDGSIINGTLEGATFEKVLPPDIESEPFHHEYTRGIWYFVKGTGDYANFTLKTEDFDREDRPFIVIYTGECDSLHRAPLASQVENIASGCWSITMYTHSGDFYYYMYVYEPSGAEIKGFNISVSTAAD